MTDLWNKTIAAITSFGYTEGDIAGVSIGASSLRWSEFVALASNPTTSVYDAAVVEEYFIVHMKNFHSLLRTAAGFHHWKPADGPFQYPPRPAVQELTEDEKQAIWDRYVIHPLIG